MHSLSKLVPKCCTARYRVEEAPSIGANQGDRFKRRGGAKVRSTAIQNASMNAFFVRMYTALHLAERGRPNIGISSPPPPFRESNTHNVFPVYILYPWLGISRSLGRRRARSISSPLFSLSIRPRQFPPLPLFRPCPSFLFFIFFFRFFDSISVHFGFPRRIGMMHWRPLQSREGEGGTFIKLTSSFFPAGGRGGGNAREGKR